VTLAILDAMLQASRSRGRQVVLMIIPPRQLRPNPSKVEELLSNWAGRTRTPLIDLREAYLRLPQEEQARLYAGHWTAYGAAVAAQVLAEKIRDMLLTPSESPRVDRLAGDSHFFAQRLSAVGSRKAPSSFFYDSRLTSTNSTERAWFRFINST
jgi:hypothetical protein